MATGFSIDRHSRKLFGLESGVKMELITHRPVLSSMLAISKFEIRGQKIVGFFMNFRRGSGGSHGGRDFFLCRVLGPLLWGFMVLVSIWISSSVHTIPHTITLVIILLYETSSSLERFIVIAAPITAAADAAAVINTPPTSRHYHCTNTII